MIVKNKICSCGCGKSGKLWSKGMLKQCFFRLNPQPAIKKKNTPLKKSRLSKQPTAKALIKKEEKKEYTKRQFELFQEFYDKHLTKRCEQCDCRINECLSINVHHLLPKSIERYKKIALIDKFWMLLCGDCHSNWESSNKGDKIAKRTEEAKFMFNIYEDEWFLMFGDKKIIDIID